MCGLLLAAIDAETAQRLHDDACASSDPQWPYARVTGLPTRQDHAPWLAGRALYPDSVYAQSAPLGYSTAYRQVSAVIIRWWRDYGAVWWQSGHQTALQTLWCLLGQLRYGRVVYNPETGIGWWQGRPRKTLFPQRLHPLGTTQWGQQTTAESLLTPATALLEASPWPMQLCCCYFGSDPADARLESDIVSLLVPTMDMVFDALAARPDGAWLVLEVDEDFGDVLQERGNSAMTNQVLIVGKGGVGKTTMTMALGLALARQGQRVLLIEADADGTLGLLLGAPERQTVGELKDALKEDRTPRVPDLTPLLAPVELGLDVLRVGHSDGPGCYCGPNNRLRAGLQPLLASYTWVIADAHAGTEVIARSVLQPTLVLVLQRGDLGDPSQLVATTYIHPALDRLEIAAPRWNVWIGGPERLSSGTERTIWLPDIGRSRSPTSCQIAAIAPPVLAALMADRELIGISG